MSIYVFAKQSLTQDIAVNQKQFSCSQIENMYVHTLGHCLFLSM